MFLISVISQCKDNILCNYKQKHNKYFVEDAFDFSKRQLKIYSNPDKSTHHWTKPDTLVSDVIGCFTVYKSSKDYPEELRKLIVENPENGTRYIFLTNNLDASAELISSLYRNRWSVELFFKWIKQHLRIKKFWGTSENAVRIQIYCAITTYCLVTIVQHDMKLERSIYEVLQILGISLTDKTHLCDLFDKSNFKNVKDRYDSSEPNLFNF